MAKRRFLPKYVSAFADRHGKERLRFRRKGFETHYFQAQFGTMAFGIEYKTCLEGKIDSVDKAIKRTVPGSIADGVTRYISVPTRLGPTADTQTKIAAIMTKFRDRYGEGPDGPCMLVDCDFEVIDTIIAAKREKVKVNGKWEGGISAARKLRKELIRLFDFCIKAKLMDVNPAAQSDQVKVAAGEKSKGYHTWTEAEIAQFRAHHPTGTKARLAMEMILWTDQRKVDTIHLGRQHILDGRFGLSQSKTGRDLRIRVAPQLMVAINAMPADQLGDMCFLVTAFGKPFTKNGFGNWFRDRCNEAGLPQCSAHGLRKATMRRMADLEMGNQQMKSVSGHVKDDEVAGYTREADQMRLADRAIDKLSRWEMATLGSKVAIGSQEGTENVA